MRALLCILPLTAVSLNPIPSLLDSSYTDQADPCILFHEETLYVYPTASQSTLEVWHAKLPEDRGADWDPSILEFEKHDTPALTPESGCILTKVIPALGSGTLTWAPHVIYDGESNMFYMYYSVCLNLYVASSSSPLGPFKDERLLKRLAIDPMLYQDDITGYSYLYYSDINLPRIWFGEESVYGIAMSSPTTFSTDPATQLIKPDQHPWEFYRSSLLAPRGINEGPWMIRDDTGSYQLMYSGAGADTAHYNIGYATCDTLIGPCVKNPNNPISDPKDPADAGVYGPGHHAVWKDTVTGKWWVWYHQKDSAEDGVWDRRLCVDELKFVDGQLVLAVGRG